MSPDKAPRAPLLNFNFRCDRSVLSPAVSGRSFIRRDEVETAWQIADAIREGWQNQPLTNREFYAAGTWGPIAAEELLAQNGHVWRDPQPVK